jgi:peptide deformylase
MTNEEINELKLVPEVHPLLYKELAPVDFTSFDARALSQRLMTIMAACHGAGLSANQVGVDAQMFVMQWPPFNGEPGGSRIVINPEIKGVSKELSQFEEGCLSFPALFIWLKRPESILVRYQDVNGEWIEETLSGWPARIFQHESDHLKGLTFDQRASKLKLDFASKRRAKIFKKNNINYEQLIRG